MSKNTNTDNPGKNDAQTKNVHAEHRKRMLNKFKEHGPEIFEDYELLEMLLFHSIPRSNTNEIAHKLLTQFGSFSGVFDSTIDRLCEVDNVGERSAILIKLVSACISQYEKSRMNIKKNAVVLSDENKVEDYFLPKFIGQTEEIVYAAYLDGSCRLIKCDKLAHGSTISVIIDPYIVVRNAVLYQARNVVLAHNHPNGEPSASIEDVEITNRISKLLLNSNVKLVSHCIVADGSVCFVDQFCSFFE